MRIERTKYLQELIDRKHNGLVKVITGIRRCGKSYLLFTLFYDHLISEGVKNENIINGLYAKMFRSQSGLYV